MGDERDQEVQRTPLWPPDPEPTNTSAQPDAAGETAAPLSHNPWDRWGVAAPNPPNPAPSAQEPRPTHPPRNPWEAAATPWEATPENAPVSEQQTMRVSAAPAPSTPESSTPEPPTPPRQSGAPAAPAAPAPSLDATDAPTQRYSAAPVPTASEPPAANVAAAGAAPQAPATPPAIPPQRERKGLTRGWRLGLTLVVIALLLASAGGLYAYASSLAAAPDHLMATYCAALKRDDYRTAYGLLSSSAQGQESETQYLADATARDTIEGPVTQCAASTTESLSPLSFLRSPRSLIFNAQITRKQAASGQIALTRDAMGWHVAALSSPLQGVDLGPLYTEQALCQALSQRAYDQAYALLSTPYQKEQGSATTFAGAFGATLTVSGCAPDLKSYRVNSADQQATFDAALTVHVPSATAGGASSAFTLPARLTFVREATGWRVDAITPLLSQ